MDETPQATNWFMYLLGLFVTLLTSIFEVYRRKVERHERLLGKFVTREELKEDIQNMHNQNLERLDSIATATQHTNNRIDAVLADRAGRRR